MFDYGFYNMDCLEGMKQFPDGYFDLAICDPPYGIGIGHKVKPNTVTVIGGVEDHSVACVQMIGGGHSGKQFGDSKGERPNLKVESKFYHPFDDSAAPNGNYFEELFRVSKAQIIWGGNFFLDYLGRATCLIVWDKGRRNLDQADCEIAWTSLKGQSRIFNFKWNGMLQEDMKNKEERVHPAQKPIALYKWLLNRFAKPNDIILDTHVGSGSSLVACRETGHKYVGFEIDEIYYKIAKKRLDDAEAQANIFDYLEQG